MFGGDVLPQTAENPWTRRRRQEAKPLDIWLHLVVRPEPV